MPKLDANTQLVIKSRWPKWLKARLDDWRALGKGGGTVDAFVSEVVATNLIGGFPTSRIGEWRDEGRAPSAQTVFAIGEALRALPLGSTAAHKSGWVSGPVALWAAGFLPDCVGFLSRLAEMTKAVKEYSRWHEDDSKAKFTWVEMPCALTVLRLIGPLAILEYGPRVGSDQRKTIQSLNVDSLLWIAREECAEAAAGSSEIFRTAWKGWTTANKDPKTPLHGAPNEFKRAYQNATTAIKNWADADLAATGALGYLAKWAERFVSENPRPVREMHNNIPTEDDRFEIIWRHRRAWEIFRALGLVDG